jgi:hypothetical protein
MKMTDLPELSLITKTAVQEPMDEAEDNEVQLFALDDQRASQEFWEVAGRLLDQHRNLLVIPLDAEPSGLLSKIREVLAEQRESFDALFEEMLYQRPLSDRRVLQAKRIAQRKQELLDRYGARTSADLAALNSRAKNPSQTAYRWQKARKIFSVDFQGKDYFPGFQFDESCRPLPAIARVLEVLDEYELKPWEIAFWFTAPTGWLGDRAPVEALDDPEVVTAAARSTYEQATF